VELRESASLGNGCGEGLTTVVSMPTTSVAVSLVDADVHPLPRSPDEIRAHLPSAWQRVPEQLISSYPLVLYLPSAQPLRRDAIGPNGETPGTDPGLTERQLFDEAGVDIAILLPLVRNHANPEYEVALCAATNDWLAATWLSEYNGHGRYKGSINVCASEPEAAAREIDRWAGHPHFVQVRLNAYSSSPYGDPRYDPIYAAAVQAGLPVAVHFSKGSGLSLLTPAGFSSSFFEHHALYPVTYAAHVVSLLCCGTFERFPELRFVFVEGGFAWVAPLLWRLENHWDAMRQELPHGARRPTEVLLEHVRFTSQPLEEPPAPGHLRATLGMADVGQLLLFSSDYPHWDYDDPRRVTARLPKAERAAVLAGNAIELYGLAPVVTR
jgi:predicted TIM-barrel fold metal-dependent hydrolase